MAKFIGDNRLKIEKEIEDKMIENHPRKYLGMSSLGHKCSRKLWYDFRLVKKAVFSARLGRLFQRGHREEAIINADLASIGVIVHSDQKEVSICQGHCQGHCDGIAERVPDAPKTPHLLEEKTCAEKYFNKLKKDGLFETFPVYYAQMVGYMKHLKLTRGLFIAVNKNNDARYYERVYENLELAAELEKKAWTIVSSEKPLPRIRENPNWHECKHFCDYTDICHHSAEVAKNCRTCHNADIYNKGKWECSRYDIEIAFEQQLLGCKRYNLLESLKKQHAR